jgi:hypothetical protein
MEFEDIVEEFDLGFQVADAQTRALKWDCDDIALIDRDYLRVALGWLPPDDLDGSWYLLAAVGPTEPAIPADAFSYVADQLVERVQAVLPADSVLHGVASQPVGPELMDTLFDLLRLTAATTRDDIAPPVPDIDDRRIFVEVEREMVKPVAENDLGNIDMSDIVMEDTRFAKWLKKRAKSTVALRLTVHTLAVSLLIFAPPVGAFMLAYTLLRDMVPLAA